MTKAADTIAQLLQRTGKGDRAAFDALCRDLERPLLRYAFVLTADPVEAEDVAQEALFRLYKMARARKVRPEFGSARSLAFTIAHHLAVDHHRRKARQPEYEPSPAPAPNVETERVLLREQIGKALADLPETHRSALALREFGDLSYEEIADTLAASRSAVKVWIHRARKRLTKLLDRDGQYVGGQCHGL